MKQEHFFIFFKFLKLIYTYGYFEGMSVHHRHAVPLGSQKMALEPLELEIQMVVRYLMSSGD